MTIALSILLAAVVAYALRERQRRVDAQQELAARIKADLANQPTVGTQGLGGGGR
jgi:cbb3-type cytochrome oxidase subunit 3